MKIAHHLNNSPTEVVGGVQAYASGLAQALVPLGSESAIVAAAGVREAREVAHEGVPVFEFPRRGSDARLRDWRRPGPELGALRAWLEAGRFDVYHLHGWSAHNNQHHVAVARSLGLPVVFTLHEAEGVCERSSLLLHGREPCDGVFNTRRCATCLGWGRNAVADAARDAVVRLPPQLSELLLERLTPRLAEKKIHRLAVRNLRTRSMLRAMRSAAAVVALCHWMQGVLIANGVPSTKVRAVRHGIALPPPDLPAPPAGEVLEIAYLGRLDWEKGVQLLAEAVGSLPADCPVRLRVFGVAYHPWEITIRDEIIACAQRDARIVYGGPLDRAGVWRMLASVDVLAVPSQVFETGPLVVHEAHAVGTPVLGMGIGGIAELVRDGVDGWLIPLSEGQTAAGWRSAILRLAADRAAVRAARVRMRAPRTMHDVAREMVEIYRSVRP